MAYYVYRLLCLLAWLLLVTVPLACVDPEDMGLFGTTDILVVDGTITNLAEPQIIKLNRSKADRLTGRFGNTPVSKALVEVIIDSTQVIACHETVDGSYLLPTNFKGQVGHIYTLRFTLSDGKRYESTAEMLQPVAPISQIRAQFNPNSLSSTQRINNVYTAAHDFYVDFADPANQTNYYRWEWNDWERQEWCHSCHGGLYQLTDAQGKLVEDCVSEPYSFPPYDYNCRTQCWEILHGNELVLYSDEVSNGRPVKAFRVAQVPLYSKEHCLVEIHQESLTQKAYAYYKQLNDQTRHSGGVASAQPALLVGNIHNLAQRNEPVVGYFTISSVSLVRYWLNRNDATGITPGLYQALNGHDPANEPPVGRLRPPLALCVPSDTRTPFKPQGWQD